MTEITIYTLEQGVKSPRDGTINWLPFEAYATLAEAKREAKNHQGRWQIVESKTVWTNEEPTP